MAETVNQVADEQMEAARHISRTHGLLVISADELRKLLEDAAQQGYQLGHEHGVGLGRKLASNPLPKRKVSKVRDGRRI
jgi:Glu-tRNA(Gln) amidotransferase subunit E-like FAD-binding protein